MALSEKRRKRSGVLRVGASSYGSYSALPLNKAAGSFGSGRTTGGSPNSAASPLMQALSGGIGSSFAPAASVQGPVADFGPPPVVASLAGEEQHPVSSPLPSFNPSPVNISSQLGIRPTFKPIPLLRVKGLTYF